jgi:signal transduction histidine kinase
MASLPPDETPTPGVLPVRTAARDLDLDDLAYLNRMTTVGQVLPSVAHELNNALQVISGLAEMVAARSDLPPDVLDKVGRMSAQAGKAVAMLRDLVAFARRDEAGVALVDLRRTVDRVLALRRYQLARARISVTLEGADPGGALVRADGHHVQQILLNLIVNAEHSLAGRSDGQIQVAIEADEGWVSVRVTDNGAGLPDGAASRVIEPFFSTKGGAGLGLTVSAALARAMGGSLEIEGSASGTTVSLRLPAARSTS